MAQSNRKGANRGGRKPASRKGMMWAAAIAVAVVLGFMGARDAGAAHPKPRSDAHDHHVVASSRYEGYPRVAQVYAKAAEIKATLDGIYCYCECSSHSGHYSLLECFETDHGASCDICMSEVELAHRLSAEGKTLDQIRSAVDGLYGP